MLRSTLAATVLGTVGVMALAGSASAELAFAVTNQGRFISFDTNAPDTLLSINFVNTLSDVITGIDLNPSDGMVYVGLGAGNFRLDLNTRRLIEIGSGTNPSFTGSTFGYDFNPTGAVPLRVVSNTDSNFRFPTPTVDRTLIRDTDLAYISGDAAFGINPNVTQIAYTNNVPNATSTVLYGIDSGRDTLVRFGSPNAGTLSTVGSLGSNLNVNVVGGFDISGASGQAFAVLQSVTSSESALYNINLTTGAATLIGNIGGGETIVAFTIVPSPSAAAIFGVAGLATLRRRR